MRDVALSCYQSMLETRSAKIKVGREEGVIGRTHANGHRKSILGRTGADSRRDYVPILDLCVLGL